MRGARGARRTPCSPPARSRRSATVGSKHLQVAPLPLLRDEGAPFPFHAALASAASSGDGVQLLAAPFAAALSRVPQSLVPVLSAGAPLEDCVAAVEAVHSGDGLLARFHACLDALGIPRDPGTPGGPSYNVLLTRDLLWVVPRVRAASGPAGANAVAFAGSLLVPDEAALEYVRHRGVAQVLRDVTGGAGDADAHGASSVL